MRRRPAYFIVWCLKDGTVLTAIQCRKPHPNEMRDGRRIEADGVCRRTIRTAEDLSESSETDKIIFQVSMAAALNMRQVLRDLVLPRLEAIERRLDALETRGRPRTG